MSSAGAASFRRHSTLQECHRQAADAVRRLRAEVDADPGAASRRETAARKRAAEDRDRRVKEALAMTEELRARQAEEARKQAERAARKGETGTDKERKKKPRKEPRASTTDAQARVMKMADGGFRPAYNVQFAADTQSGAVAAVAVDNVGSDMGKMAPMNEALAARSEEHTSELQSH